MEITEVKVSVREEKKLKGFANITLDDTFVIRGLKIIQGVNRYFVAMPSRKKRDGSFSDVAHPITNDFRDKMEKAILEQYWEEVGEYSEAPSMQMEYA